jgi:molybdopterin-dependent oxidoreductase alpha subunit
MSRPPDERPAGGLEAVLSTAREAARHGPARVVRALARVNREGGFDCPGCAWPEPGRRGLVEFCEQGAKAVAHEATRARCGPEFFARWPIPALLEKTDHWLEQQGRLTHPLRKAPGADRYEPVSWEDAFARIGELLRGLDSPDQAVFYTSGRTSNEAAFLYQLLVRSFGTNNLPDCSNMCHESSSTGLSDAIGFGKASVGLEDFELADLVLVLGQNPGTNHPRMLATLQAAARRGCEIVSINPLRERGLVAFAHPRRPLEWLGAGTPLARRFVRVRVGGDVALLKGVMKECLRLEAERPGRVLDHAFLSAHTEGFEAFRGALDAVPLEECERESGIARDEMRALAELYARSERVIACWAMGLTQHRFGVENVQEVVNLLLLRGNLGRPGAGVCPVRGHSNVQGDRTMGIWERPSPAFLDRLAAEFGFEPPRRPGLSTVEAIRAMLEGRARALVALGGNFAVATPDPLATHEALCRCRLTVQVSTKLNRSHLVTGEEAFALPCLARSERDLGPAGPNFVTVEDSMRAVHRSQGRLPPASGHLRSEPAIVAGLARALLGPGHSVHWEELAADYDRIRERIARVIPGFEDMNRRIREPGGFVLQSPAHRREFATPSGRARLSVVPLPRLPLRPGEYLMTTVRSHDQYNTSVYGLADRYRGVEGRRVVLVHPDDLAREGLAPGQLVDLVSDLEGERRVARGFRVEPYDTPRGCVVTYFPEANELVPLRHHAARSRTPAYKSTPVRLRPAAAGPGDPQP